MRESLRLTPAQEMRLFIGFAAQPFAAAALAFVGFPLLALSAHTLDAGPSREPLRAAAALAIAAAIVACVACVVTVCAAFPWVVWQLKRGPLRLRTLLGGGAALGNLPFAVLMLLAALAPRHFDPPAFVVRELVGPLVVGAVFGLVGAAVFWAVSVRGTSLEDRGST